MTGDALLDQMKYQEYGRWKRYKMSCDLEMVDV